MGIISTDPGQSGSTCYLPSSGGDVLFLDHKQNDIVEVHRWIEQRLLQGVEYCIIEDVHSLFGMSAKSNFSFGRNLGVMTTLLELTQLPVHKVQPKVWQKYLGCTQPSGKKLKKEVAQLIGELYPTATFTGPRGGLMDGRSDCLAIGHYAINNI